MSLRIERISVRNLGPLEAFDEALAELNLFYGPNESGKTFLVEFIIGTLFKKRDYWGRLREMNCQGRLYLSGPDGKRVEFSLTSGRGRKTLADYINASNLPFNLSLQKTLIVRGGDVAIGPDGLSKEILKEVFFQRSFYTNLLNRLPRTVRTAEIEEDGRIIIDKRGDRERGEIKERLQKIEGLIKRLHEIYDQAYRRQLQLKKEALEERIKALLKAKRHRAWVLSQEIKRVEEELKKLPQEDEIEKLQKEVQEIDSLKQVLRKKEAQRQDLEPGLKELQRIEEMRRRYTIARAYRAWVLSRQIRELESRLRKIPWEAIQDLQTKVLRFKELKRDYEERLSQVQEIEEKVRHLDYLRIAERQYRDLLKGLWPRPVHWVLTAGAVLLILGGIWGFLKDIDSLGIVLLCLGLSMVGVTVYTLIKGTRRAEEIETLKARVQELFGRRIEGIVDLEALIQDVERQEMEKRAMGLPEMEDRLKGLKEEIERGFWRLGRGEVGQDRWDEALKGLIEEHEDLRNKIEEKRLEHKGLGVEEKEYVERDPGIGFDREEFNRLESIRSELREDRTRASTLDKEINEGSAELKARGEAIRAKLQEIFSEEVTEDLWHRRVRELALRHRDLKERLLRMMTELKTLNIPEEAYEKEDPGIVYDPGELERTEKELRQVDEEIKDLEQLLAELKGHICNETGIDRSSDWDVLIDRLYSLREEILGHLKGKTTEVVASILLAKEIQKIQQEEDRQISALINSTQVKAFLQKITGRYHSFGIDNERFYVSDSYETFDFNDLSTGAQEQVLLALRLGMALKVSGQETGFILLDDAFQHVDWKKRPLLVQGLIEVVKMGWQVIYLTMDDHIRDLFKRYANGLGERYRFFDLRSIAEGAGRLF